MSAGKNQEYHEFFISTLKITATIEGVDIKGYIDSGALTVEQALGRLSTDAYDYLLPFAFIIKSGIIV